VDGVHLTMFGASNDGGMIVCHSTFAVLIAVAIY